MESVLSAAVCIVSSLLLSAGPKVVSLFHQKAFRRIKMSLNIHRVHAGMRELLTNNQQSMK